jgi:Zn-dependent peptidase ImmA (M78 family)
VEADLKADDDSQCDGLCDLQKRIVYLDASLKGKKRTATFLHELFHVLVHEAHINPGVRFSEGVEEVLCDAFADLLLTSFKLKWKKQK